MMEKKEGLWALNIKKGTIVKHPSAGDLPGLVAVPIDEKTANQVKHLHGVVVFNGICVEKSDVTIINEDKDGSNTS